MKKHIILAAVAALASFTACSNDDEKEMNQNVPVHFNITSESITTRATTTASRDNYSTTFEINDEIGIYTSGLVNEQGLTGNDMTNAQYTYNGSELTTDGSASYYYPKTGEAKFYAYYPYSETAASNGVVSFGVQTDQSVEANFKKSDFMTCVKTQASTSQAITLSMSHRLALVEVVLTNMDGASVEINGVKTGFTWTIANDAVATTGDANSTVKMYKQSTATHWALVPQQNITQGSKLFTITHAGYTYYYTINTAAGINLEANKVNRFKLSKTVTGKIVATPNVSADSWNGLGNGEDGEVSEKNYISSWPADGSLTSVTGFGSVNSTNSWCYNTSSSTGLTSASYSISNNTFTVVTPSASSSFSWARALFVYSAELLSAGQYVVSFKISSDSDNTTVSKVSVVLAGYNTSTTNNAYFFPTSDNKGFNNYGVTTLAKTVEATFDTATYFNSNSVGTNFSKTGDSAEEQFANGFKIAIGFGTDASNEITYTLSDLKITKK